MPETITLRLPNTLFQPIQRISEALEEPIETILLNALRASLPSLAGLTDELAIELTQLDVLSNDALYKVMLETVPVKIEQEVEELLAKNQAGTLKNKEEDRLEELQNKIEKVGLRKARAAVLLRFRGQRLPTRSELHRLTFA